eukprot:Selendium_serpulae@DN883_c0_g1_i1.p1
MLTMPEAMWMLAPGAAYSVWVVGPSLSKLFKASLLAMGIFFWWCMGKEVMRANSQIRSYANSLKNGVGELHLDSQLEDWLLMVAILFLVSVGLWFLHRTAKYSDCNKSLSLQ